MLMVVCSVYPRKRDPVDPLPGRCGAVGVRLQVSGPDQILHAGAYSCVSLCIPRLLAAATASTLRLAEVSPSCSLIAFSSCMVLLPTMILPSGYWTLPGYMLCGCVLWDHGYANFREFQFRDCLIIPERPRSGLLRVVKTDPEAPFRYLEYR